VSISIPPTAELRFLEAREPILRVISWADATYTVHVRGYTKHGLFIIEHKTNSDRSRKHEDYRLPDLPVGVRVHSPSPPTERGRLFVRLELFMGGANAQTLCSGYITRRYTLTWPTGQFEHSTEGPGAIKNIIGTDPPAGNEISETVPTNARWRLLGFHATLTTDSTVITREANIIIDDGTNEIFETGSGMTAGASSSLVEIATPIQIRGIISANRRSAPLPPNGVMMKAGWRIRTNTNNLQAGDNWAAPRLLVEEWIED